MFRFLVWYKRTKKYETRIQTSVDNTVNDLPCEIKFGNCLNGKKITFLFSETLLFFFKQKYILFLETYLFKITKNLIASAFFLPRQILKNMPRRISNAAQIKPQNSQSLLLHEMAFAVKKIKLYRENVC